MVHTGLPESRQTPTKSGPGASMSVFSSRACMSPAWFSIATLTPASDRATAMFFSTLTVSSMCRSMPPRSAALRARHGRSATGRSSRRRSSSRAALRPCPAPCRTSPTSGRSSACRSRDPVRARRRVARTLFRLSGSSDAEKTDLAEMDDLDVPLRGEVDLLKRRPVLLPRGCTCRRRIALASPVSATLRSGSAHNRRGQCQGRGPESFHKRPSICRHVVLCWHGDPPVKRTDDLFEPIVVVLLLGSVGPGLLLPGFPEPVDPNGLRSTSL